MTRKEIEGLYSPRNKVRTPAPCADDVPARLNAMMRALNRFCSSRAPPQTQLVGILKKHKGTFKVGTKDCNTSELAEDGEGHTKKHLINMAVTLAWENSEYYEPQFKEGGKTQSDFMAFADVTSPFKKNAGGRRKKEVE